MLSVIDLIRIANNNYIYIDESTEAFYDEKELHCNLGMKLSVQVASPHKKESKSSQESQFSLCSDRVHHLISLLVYIQFRSPNYLYLQFKFGFHPL